VGAPWRGQPVVSVDTKKKELVGHGEWNYTIQPAA
jgi:hypothetical protein